MLLAASCGGTNGPEPNRGDDRSHVGGPATGVRGGVGGHRLRRRMDRAVSHTRPSSLRSGRRETGLQGNPVRVEDDGRDRQVDRVGFARIG